MVFFSDQDGKQGIYNCWPKGARGCHTHTYCRAICDGGQTESQRSRFPKAFRSQVNQETQRLRDKQNMKPTINYNKFTNSIRAYTIVFVNHFALRAFPIYYIAGFSCTLSLVLRSQTAFFRKKAVWLRETKPDPIVTERLSIRGDKYKGRLPFLIEYL